MSAELGKLFECVMPRHHHAAKIERVGGVWRYRCGGWQRPLGWSFADVFASQVAGAETMLGDGPLASRWFDLLSYRAGVLEPMAVEIAVPAACGATVARVAAHIALFLGLREAGGGYGPGEPFTFAREFVVAYCGVSNMGARRAMAALEKHASIERTGETVEVWGGQRAILWRLPT